MSRRPVTRFIDNIINIINYVKSMPPPVPKALGPKREHPVECFVIIVLKKVLLAIVRR